MQTFIGTKIIKAIPMTRAMYNGYRNWPLPNDENGLDDGYLVEYTDGGPPNSPLHEGYISWSPKEQFDKAYRAIELPEGYQYFHPRHQRMIIEQLNLDDKITKLLTFMEDPKFLMLDADEREDLKEQLAAMEVYYNCLDSRIARCN
jgi:hypothetical protein